MTGPTWPAPSTASLVGCVVALLGRSSPGDGAGGRRKRTFPRLYSQRLEVVSGGRGAASRRERVPHHYRSSAIGRFVKDGPDRVAQFGGAQLVDAQRYPGPRVGDLPGNDRLIVPHRRDDQRQAMGQRLAHGVLATVAHHG